MMMRHPYTGEVVQCERHKGDVHAGEHPTHWLAMGPCYFCDNDIIECRTCRAVIECCACGQAHALECPWPL